METPHLRDFDEEEPLVDNEHEPEVAAGQRRGEENDEIDDLTAEESAGDNSDSHDSEGDVVENDITHELEEEGELAAKGYLVLGKEYDSVKEVKRDVFWYSLKARKNLVYVKSDSSRLTVECDYKGCPWRFHASFHSGSGKIRVKGLNDEHRCVDTEKNKLFKIPRIVEQCIDLFRQWPKMNPSDIRSHILSTYKVLVSMPQCREVRRKCRSILIKENEEQFERLWDYVVEIKRTNPGSTVVLETDANVFKRIYIMFGAMKEGWKSCRNVIHLDGAFLKWEMKGEVLSAVARDANDQLYPLAWAIVEVENKENWTWFIENLSEDLDLSVGEGLTVISDQQKGIILALANLLPICEHRMCARHIWANLKKKCNDGELKRLFWKAAKSYTEVQFRECLEKIKMIQILGYNELLKQDARHWSRAFFSTICKCDSIDNNFSESFNSMIREARKKPVVEMLETIRQAVMLSNGKKITEIEAYNGLITPKAQELVNIQKEIASGCTVFSNGKRRFEVVYKDARFVINLQTQAGQFLGCSCRYTDLTGIPCGHIVAAVWEDSRGQMQPEFMVADCWTTSSWKACYASIMEPVNGMGLWERTTEIRVLPPPIRVMPGRPRKNDRRKEPLELQSNRGVLTHHGRVFHCKHCLGAGHNTRTCPKKDEPRTSLPEKQPRGRPRIHPVREEGTSKRPRVKSKKNQTNATVVQSQESCSMNYPRVNYGHGVYVSPISGDTYYHMGSRSIDTRDNTVFSTSLQRERDLQKRNQQRRASTNQ